MKALHYLPLFFLLVWAPGLAQNGREVISEEITGHIYKPARVDATPERIRQLRVPEGFRISVFAEGLGAPRMMAVGPDGAVYVSRRKSNDVLMLKDTDGDGTADDSLSVIQKKGAHGLAIHGGQLYLVTVNEVFRGELQPDGSVGELETLIDTIPAGGQHPNRTIRFGPDGMMYVTVGSLLIADDSNGVIYRVAYER